MYQIDQKSSKKKVDRDGRNAYLRIYSKPCVQCFQFVLNYTPYYSPTDLIRTDLFDQLLQTQYWPRCSYLKFDEFNFDRIVLLGCTSIFHRYEWLLFEVHRAPMKLNKCTVSIMSSDDEDVFSFSRWLCNEKRTSRYWIRPLLNVKQHNSNADAKELTDDEDKFQIVSWKCLQELLW